jgi:hypothetical protein
MVSSAGLSLGPQDRFSGPSGSVMWERLLKHVA